MRFPPLLLVLLASRIVFGQGAPVLELTDFSGVWAERVHEDSYERSGGPPLGDYQGIPLNDAGRRKADSHDHSEWSLPGVSVPPAFGSLSVARAGQRTILERSGSHWARSCARFTSNICGHWIA